MTEVRRQARSSLRIGVLLALVVAATAVALPSVPARASRRQPNILFVLADDLDIGEMPYLPEVNALIAQHGATFQQHFVSDSLCCPSRTTTLRGQFAHNTGVKSNGGRNGGFDTAFRAGVETDTFATRLSAVGYRTGLFGKYLNGYPGVAGSRYVPEGWTEWASPISGHPYNEYDYRLNHNARLESHGTKPQDYGTDVYVQNTERFIAHAAREDQPFLAYLSVFAPHEPATPAPADVDRFAGAHAPRTPSFDQADVSAMPVFIRDLPPLVTDETAAIDRLYQRRIESLQAVDRGVAELVATLRNLHELRNTYIAFTSDNGFHLGQHRLPAGKETPYDTDIHVPFVVRGPGIFPHSAVTTMTANTDLAPTFVAMAGAKKNSHWDGHSLLGLARGRPVTAANRRTIQLVEHWTETATDDPLPPGVYEPADVDQADPRLHPTSLTGPGQLSDHTIYGYLVRIPDYVGVRTERYLYVEYVNGDRELYDVRRDPDEMQNLAGTQPAVEAALARHLAQLRDCRGQSCRKAERSASMRAEDGAGLSR